MAISSKRKECTFVGCIKESLGKGLCSGHYAQNRRGQELRPLKTTRSPRHSPDGLCLFESCGLDARSHGLCQYHYRQDRRGEQLMARPTRTEAEGWNTTNGYRAWYRPDHPNSGSKTGVIYEHILRMSEHLGRPLLPHEEVHHRYGDKKDNRIESLELWTVSQPKGQRVEDKIQWAIDFLEEYGYNVVPPAKSMVL